MLWHACHGTDDDVDEVREDAEEGEGEGEGLKKEEEEGRGEGGEEEVFNHYKTMVTTGYMRAGMSRAPGQQLGTGGYHARPGGGGELLPAPHIALLSLSRCLLVHSLLFVCITFCVCV